MSIAAVMPKPVLDLGQLTRMGPTALAQVYAAGTLPELPSVSGVPHGRMLALDALGDSPRIARLAAKLRFPWRGKSFSGDSTFAGEGINRIRLFGDRQWYRFETYTAPSVLDGQPCVLLNYDLADNPWFIRRIRDEIREVASGLFMGPALVRKRGRHTRVLHFAIDHGSAAT